MAHTLSSITKGRRDTAKRIFTFGPHGIGKTSWAAGAPSPVFIPTEDGLGLLETPAFDLVTTTAQAIEAMSALYYEAHEYKTVVLDSADWLDNIINAEVRNSYNEKELAFGKDMVRIAEHWKPILDWFNALRSKGMTVILLGHCDIKRFDPPDGDSYERYQPKMTKWASALIQEWADCVLFANWRTYVNKEVVGNASAKNPATKSKAMATAERLLFTGEKPAHLAKNRYNLPAELPLSWQAFADAMAQSRA